MLITLKSIIYHNPLTLKKNTMEQHVNSIMKSINTYTDNIYESLMDNDVEELNKNIFLLINLLKDIQRKDEI